MLYTPSTLSRLPSRRTTQQAVPSGRRIVEEFERCSKCLAERSSLKQLAALKLDIQLRFDTVRHEPRLDQLSRLGWQDRACELLPTEGAEPSCVFEGRL